MAIPKLYIIIPCYNESDVLHITAPMFLDELLHLINTNRVSEESRIIYVNDGSKDDTWKIITDLAKENKYYKGICQSRNRGHQNAVLAGLMEAMNCCDITISIDCDGQDDVKAMEQMVDEYLAGSEVVYGVRDNRNTDSFLKKFTAESFYKIMNLLGADIVFNHADYRLISSRVLKEFAEFKEVNLFLRGMIPLVGFKSSNVYYKRNARVAGDSHYTFSKMLGLALDGITSLSVKPLMLISIFGVVVSLISFIGIITCIINQLVTSNVEEWVAMTCVLCFLGGIQLIAMGVLGIYIGKVYMEVKNRPRYIISDRTPEE